MNYKARKIAILTPTFFEYSGIDRLVESEADLLNKNNNAISIFTFSATIRTKNAKVFILGMPKNQLLERLYRLFFFLDIKKVIKYTRALKNYDIVISHFYPMNILAYFAKKLYNIQYLYYNAGVAFPHLFEKFSEKAYMRIFKFLNNITIKNADKIISISRYLRAELKKETGLDSIVEYPPIDKKRFKRKANGTSIRKKYALGKSPLILYIGRISPHKGIHLLITAFKIAKEKIPDIKLIIVGKATFNNYFDKLKALTNGIAKDVIFTGFVPDNKIVEYYVSCDIYATASLWEGYNLPIAEAQACGKPVVAFDLCSHPEVVKNGILVKPNDTKAFAEAMIRLLRKQ